VPRGYSKAMDFLFLALFVATLLALIYLIRSMRALHKKVGKQTERLSNGIQKLTEQNRNVSINDYRQLEAFVQLNSLLNFSAPLPATRGWAGSPDLLLTLAHAVKTFKPKLVVELGSGVSTVVMGKAGAKKIVSFDGSEEYAGHTRNLLKAHGIKGAEVRYSKLSPFKNSSGWYDPNSFKDLKKIDLLVIDGPPGGDDVNGRYPALDVLLSKLSPNAVVILDDAKRPGERRLADDFAAALPKHSLTILDHEKGTAVIRPK
jgi:predicted O-methyltransferase YrrM